MNWPRKTSGLGAFVAAAIVSGGVASASIPQGHTQAGEARARAELLARSQLGPGWFVSSAARRHVPALTCSTFAPAVQGATEVGAAASPTFAQSTNGPFAAQVSYAYATPAQQLSVWRAVVRAALGRCFKASLLHGSGHGVTFTASGVKRLSLLGVPGRSAEYRVTGVATVPDQSVPVYLDAILIGRGAGISELSLSTFLRPEAHRTELRLARAISQKMAGS
jgi:hypothetical protein